MSLRAVLRLQGRPAEKTKCRDTVSPGPSRNAKCSPASKSVMMRPVPSRTGEALGSCWPRPRRCRILGSASLASASKHAVRGFAAVLVYGIGCDRPIRGRGFRRQFRQQRASPGPQFAVGVFPGLSASIWSTLH